MGATWKKWFKTYNQQECEALVRSEARRHGHVVLEGDGQTLRDCIVESLTIKGNSCHVRNVLVLGDLESYGNNSVKGHFGPSGGGISSNAGSVTISGFRNWSAAARHYKLI